QMELQKPDLYLGLEQKRRDKQRSSTGIFPSCMKISLAYFLRAAWRRRQALLFLSSQSIGSQSSTLFPSGSMIHANFPFSADSGPDTISIPDARSCPSISSRLSTR